MPLGKAVMFFHQLTVESLPGSGLNGPDVRESGRTGKRRRGRERGRLRGKREEKQETLAREYRQTEETVRSLKSRKESLEQDVQELEEEMQTLPTWETLGDTQLHPLSGCIPSPRGQDQPLILLRASHRGHQ